MANCIIQKISALPVDTDSVYALLYDYHLACTKLAEAYPGTPIMHWPAGDISHQQPASQEVHYTEILQPLVCKYNKHGHRHILFVIRTPAVKHPVPNANIPYPFSLARLNIPYQVLIYFQISIADSSPAAAHRLEAKLPTVETFPVVKWLWAPPAVHFQKANMSQHHSQTDLFLTDILDRM